MSWIHTLAACILCIDEWVKSLWRILQLLTDCLHAFKLHSLQNLENKVIKDDISHITRENLSKSSTYWNKSPKRIMQHLTGFLNLWPLPATLFRINCDWKVHIHQQLASFVLMSEALHCIHQENIAARNRLPRCKFFFQILIDFFGLSP